MLADFLELMADHGATVIGPHGSQLNPALCKIEHLQGARVGNKLLDILGNQLFRADNHVHRYIFTVEKRFLVGQVLLRANARNLGGCIEQGVGHLAGHHVDLITVGDGYQHIGVFGTCFEQCVGMRGLARDGADVQPVLQQAQLFTVDVYHRDVILFVSQVFGQGTADLTGAENNDFHSSASSTRVMGLE